MRTKVTNYRRFVVAAVAAIGIAGAARHASACTNDVDCTDTNGNFCGGQVCDYSTGTPTCKPAGTGPKGADGWCGQSSDCKCQALGATCNSATSMCTFTLPSQAPDAGATGIGGAAGATSTGTGGAHAVGGGSGGSAAATGGAAGSSSSSSSGGGCAMAGGEGPMSFGAALALLGALVLGRRRNRRGTCA
jgi:MYXO-CTERM domain-containing protein